MVEYHDRIALKPIASFREVLGLCKINGDNKDFEPWDGMLPLMVQLSETTRALIAPSSANPAHG